MDEETLEIRAVEVTSSNVGDAPMLPDLLKQIGPDQDIATVSAELPRMRHRFEHRWRRLRHARLPRRRRRPWRGGGHSAPPKCATMEAGYSRSPGTQRDPVSIEALGRALWRNWSGYHRRSRVETKMNCVKLLGQRLMSRDFDRQVAEVQIRALAAALEPMALAAHSSTASRPSASRSPWHWDRCVRGKGNCGHQMICATAPPGHPLDVTPRQRPPKWAPGKRSVPARRGGQPEIRMHGSKGSRPGLARCCTS
ncbi:transposase [Poseidonocella sp. HB161398]|uniref:transposase n=1 Tax=Poseidonocella sp. HB161398 TaxID=2320855 RepID=UPI003519B6FF